jgi:hypothetical protein
MRRQKIIIQILSVLHNEEFCDLSSHVLLLRCVRSIVLMSMSKYDGKTPWKIL